MEHLIGERSFSSQVLSILETTARSALLHLHTFDSQVTDSTSWYVGSGAAADTGANFVKRCCFSGASQYCSFKCRQKSIALLDR